MRLGSWGGLADALPFSRNSNPSGVDDPRRGLSPGVESGVRKNILGSCGCMLNLVPGQDKRV